MSPPANSDASQSETQKTIGSLKAGYPATALVSILLQHYGIDFAKYKRNVHTSRKLWELWKDVYDAILGHMDKVHNAATPDWDSFSAYTEAIGPFEKELLELENPLSLNELSAVPTKDDVSALITFMGTWALNRGKFLETSKTLEAKHYNDLFPQALQAESDVKKALNEDDKDVLKELTKGITEHELQDSDILEAGTETLVTDVKAKVKAIQTAADSLTPDDHAQMGDVVHAVMAIYIPFLARDKDTDNAHIVSKKVWNAAKAFADDTEKFAKKDASISSEQFKTKWEAYRAILMDQIDAFAMQMVTLMRLAANVRRPFFGRTVGIVRMWQALSGNDDFRNEKKASARKKLQKLLVDTQDEFTKTNTQVNSFNNDLEKVVAERKESYTNLVTRLQTEIKAYNPTKWEQVEKDYNKGSETDDEHLAKFQKFVKDNERAATLQADIRA